MRDRQWVRQILKGDKVAGERFVTEHYPRIYRLLRYLTNDLSVTEDLTQQTFIKAWQALEGYRGEARLVTWLHHIAYHEYTHWLRGQRDEASLDEAAHLADPLAMRGLQTVVLEHAISQLTADLRVTFLLHYVQELSVTDVAKVLSVPEGTIKSRLFTARQRLRETLQGATAESVRMPVSLPLLEEKLR